MVGQSHWGCSMLLIHMHIHKKAQAYIRTYLYTYLHRSYAGIRQASSRLLRFGFARRLRSFQDRGFGWLVENLRHLRIK